MLSSCPGGSFLWSRLQRVMKKQQLPLEMAPVGRIRTATSTADPELQGESQRGHGSPPCSLLDLRTRSWEGSLSSCALTGDVRSRDGHEPRDFTCWTCLRQLVPQRSSSRVPPSRSSESCLSLSLSSLHLGIHWGNCLLHVLELPWRV